MCRLRAFGLVVLMTGLLLAGDPAPIPARSSPERGRDIGGVRREVETLHEAAAWLLRGDVTVRQLERASGIQPRADGPGYRWLFPDGVLVTDGQRLPNGEFLIRCWGPLPGR